jgi:hypothetical protein
MSEPVDTAADSDEIPVAAGICENGLAPHTFCGSNTLLAWLKRVHAFEQGLLAA